MILSARKRHRIIWVCLAIILAIIFAVSVIFRHSEPINEKIPQIKTK
jgi:uncharacterized protein YpmB